MPDNTAAQRTASGKKKEVLSTSVMLLVVIAACIFIVQFVGQRTVVHGSSMEPTLTGSDDNDSSKHADNLIVDKISYRFSDPKRFDIIVFPYYANGVKENLIKRIIGMPGETVQIDFDGNIFINGEQLQEDYGKETIVSPGRAANPIELGDDEYFVLGDNRNNSADSRTERIGNVSRSSIIGKAWVRIWPPSRMGLLRHQ